MPGIRAGHRKRKRVTVRARSSDKMQWTSLWKGLRAGREGFFTLPVKVQNENIAGVAKLGLSAPNIGRVLGVTRGLVLARARDYPRVIKLRGDTEAHRNMNRYLRTLS